jgi:hypothetical protein
VTTFYLAIFFACSRTFAHLLFAAAAIFALPAADKTRLLTPDTPEFRTETLVG